MLPRSPEGFRSERYVPEAFGATTGADWELAPVDVGGTAEEATPDGVAESVLLKTTTIAVTTITAATMLPAIVHKRVRLGRIRAT